jgi:hypothetical protein
MSTKEPGSLETNGFQGECGMVGLTIKADVRIRIVRRRLYADPATDPQLSMPEPEVRYELL